MLTLDHFGPDILIENYGDEGELQESLSAWPRTSEDAVRISAFIASAKDANERENRLFIMYMFLIREVSKDDIFAQRGVVDPARDLAQRALENLAIQDRERFMRISQEVLDFLINTPEERSYFLGLTGAIAQASAAMWETGVLNPNAVELIQTAVPRVPPGFE